MSQDWDKDGVEKGICVVRNIDVVPSTFIYIFSCVILILLLPPINTVLHVPDHKSCPQHNEWVPVLKSHNNFYLPGPHSSALLPCKQKKPRYQILPLRLPLTDTTFFYAWNHSTPFSCGIWQTSSIP